MLLEDDFEQVIGASWKLLLESLFFNSLDDSFSVEEAGACIVEANQYGMNILFICLWMFIYSRSFHNQPKAGESGSVKGAFQSNYFLSFLNGNNFRMQSITRANFNGSSSICSELHWVGNVCPCECHFTHSFIIMQMHIFIEIIHWPNLEIARFRSKNKTTNAIGRCISAYNVNQLLLSWNPLGEMLARFWIPKNLLIPL